MRSDSFPVATFRTVTLQRSRRKFAESHRLPHRSVAVLRFPSEAEFPVVAEIEDGGRVEIYRAVEGLLYRRARIRGRTRARVRPANTACGDDCVFDEKAGLFGGSVVPGSGDEPFPDSYVRYALAGEVDDRCWINPFSPRKEEDLGAGSTVVDEGVEDADARVSRIASRMAVFGDALWLAVREPIWKGLAGVVQFGVPSDEGEDNGFRLDRQEAARNAARRRHVGDVRAHGCVRFLDPAHLSYDETAALALFIGAGALEVEAAQVQLLPFDKVATLLTLRQLVAEGMPKTSAEAAGLVAAAQAYAAALESVPFNGFGREAGPLPRLTLARAVNRWKEIAPTILSEEDDDALSALGSG